MGDQTIALVRAKLTKTAKVKRMAGSHLAGVTLLQKPRAMLVETIFACVHFLVEHFEGCGKCKKRQSGAFQGCEWMLWTLGANSDKESL